MFNYNSINHAGSAHTDFVESIKIAGILVNSGFIRPAVKSGGGKMAELRCSVENCTYNCDRCCCKGDIMVGGQKACCCGETCCESFTQRREGTDSFKSSVVHPSKTISIDCEAVNCLYNSNYKCVADHVDIRGCGACDCRETACGTFTEK